MKEKLKLILSGFLMLTIIVPTVVTAEKPVASQVSETTVVPTVETTGEPIDTQVPQNTVVPSESPVFTDSPVATTEPTNTPELVETPGVADKEVISQNNSSGQIAPEPSFGDAEIVEHGEIDGTQYTITDIGINAVAAQQMLEMQDAGISMYANTAQLTREKRVARFWTGLPTSDNGYDYASKFLLNGKVSYLYGES